MKCPNCNEEIKYVHRFLIIEEGVPHPIAEDGSVDINANPEPHPGDEIRQHDGGEGWSVWYECPLCHGEIDRWDEDGAANTVACSYCGTDVCIEDSALCDKCGKSACEKCVDEKFAEPTDVPFPHICKECV
jgi:hypothetical protein